MISNKIRAFSRHRFPLQHIRKLPLGLLQQLLIRQDLQSRKRQRLSRPQRSNMRIPRPCSLRKPRIMRPLLTQNPKP